MRKGRIAAVFVLGSMGLTGAGAGIAAGVMGGEPGRSVVLGAGLGWAGALAGFVLLLANLDRSSNRFLAAYVAGFLLRLALLGAAFGLAAVGGRDPVPLLLGLAATVFALLLFEGTVLWVGTREKRECP